VTSIEQCATPRLPISDSREPCCL